MRRLDIVFGKESKIDRSTKVKPEYEISPEESDCCVICGYPVEVVAFGVTLCQEYYSFRRDWDAFGRGSG